VKRVLIFGRGGSGKSTLATKLGEIIGLPTLELDKIFWQAGLQPMPHDVWVNTQQKLIKREGWIIDGDLGLYDAMEVRLAAADTIILLDFSLLRCAWRALRRGRERSDFWRWLLMYRRRSLPELKQALSKFAPHAKLHVMKNPRELQRFIAELEQRPRSN
jgi:cytidylate kinase